MSTTGTQRLDGREGVSLFVRIDAEAPGTRLVTASRLPVSAVASASDVSRLVGLRVYAHGRTGRPSIEVAADLVSKGRCCLPGPG